MGHIAIGSCAVCSPPTLLYYCEDLHETLCHTEISIKYKCMIDSFDIFSSGASAQFSPDNKDAPALRAAGLWRPFTAFQLLHARGSAVSTGKRQKKKIRNSRLSLGGPARAVPRPCFSFGFWVPVSVSITFAKFLRRLK